MKSKFLLGLVFAALVAIMGYGVSPPDAPGAKSAEQVGALLPAPAAGHAASIVIEDQIMVADANGSPQRAPVLYAQAPTSAPDTTLADESGSSGGLPDSPGGSEGSNDDNGNFWAFVRLHWQELFWGVLGLFEVIARLTPSERDNSILNWIKGVFDTFFPNKDTGGGLHA